MIVQWEYKVVKFPYRVGTSGNLSDEDALNLLGGEGWELISFDMQTGVIVLKRPVLEIPE